MRVKVQRVKVMKDLRSNINRVMKRDDCYRNYWSRIGKYVFKRQRIFRSLSYRNFISGYAGEFGQVPRRDAIFPREF